MSLTKSLRLAGHGPFSSKTTILGLKKLTKDDDVETMSDCLVGEFDFDSEGKHAHISHDDGPFFLGFSRLRWWYWKWESLS